MIMHDQIMYDGEFVEGKIARVGWVWRFVALYHSTFFALFRGQRKDMHEHWEHPRILGGQTKGSVVDVDDPLLEARKTRHV
jgi:hypothetical protein